MCGGSRENNISAKVTEKGLCPFSSKNAIASLLFYFFSDDCQSGIDCGIFDLLPEINANYEKWVESSN